MSQENSSIEVKVGALVLVSLVLLGGFVFVLGDVSFSSTGKRFHVRFENAGGLKPGADVAIAGLKVGQVESLSFMHKTESERRGESVAVRATITVQEEHADSIREGSDFFISTRSVLGEPYIEVVTPSLDSPPVENGETVKGTSPPRFDLLISKTSTLLDGFIDLFRDSEVSVDEFFAHTASLVKHVDEFFVNNREDLSKVVAGARDAAKRAASILAAIQYAVGDDETAKATFDDFRATLSNARTITDQLDDDVGPMSEDVAKAAENARKATALTDEILEVNKPKIDESVTNLQESTRNVKQLSGDANQLVAGIKNGEGTVGKLLQDRKLYDDLREMLRIIKRQPWKIMWKE